MLKRKTSALAAGCSLALLSTLTGCGGQATAPVESVREAPVKQLTTTDTAFEANPIYAPDGAGVLFESDASGNNEIWFLPGSGAAAVQLTHNAADDTAPFWLPDGSGYVFESDRSGSKSIWVQDLANPEAAAVQITDDAGEDGSPAVSPDGRFVVYESNRGWPGGLDLWVSPIGGGTPVRLTISVDGSYDRSPDWSPGGQNIVFESNREQGLSALFIVPAKGGDPVRVTPTAGYEGHPAWSPDGGRIAYESTLSGSMEIWCVDADGQEARRLTTDGGYWPRWNPDGRRIVFCNWGALAPNVWELAVQ